MMSLMSLESALLYPKALLLLHRPRIAPAAFAPKIGLPLARDSAWSSSKLLPAPARLDTVVSPTGTPCIRFTVP